MILVPFIFVLQSLQNLRLFRGSKMEDVQKFLSTIEKALREEDTVFGETLKLIVIDSLPIIMYPLLTSVDDCKFQLHYLLFHVM